MTIRLRVLIAVLTACWFAIILYPNVGLL